MRALRFCASLLTLALIGCATPADAPPPASAAPPPAVAAPTRLPTVCKDEDDWNEAAAPRRIFGNTWYVGSCGISAILITSPQGHILIDGATEQAARGIAAAIEATGARLRDVRILLTTHEHFDHVGGLAWLQHATGATVLARAAAAEVLRAGRSTRSDPQFGSLHPFPPIARVQVIADDAVVALGDLAVRLHATPGHAPGGSSWSWRSCNNGSDCRQIVYADSVSALADDAYRYRDHPEHVARFRAGMAAIADITPCDILLTPHPASSDLWPRLRGEQPMVTAEGCRRHAAAGRAHLDTRLQQEAAGEVH